MNLSRAAILTALVTSSAHAIPAAPTGMTDLFELAEYAGRLHGLPPHLMRAMVQAESSGDPKALSAVGAMGLTQLMPGTARDMGISDPWNPWQNVYGGAKYLRLQLEAFGGRLDYALAAYNASAGNVRKYGGVPPFSETRKHVTKVITFYNLYSGDDYPLPDYSLPSPPPLRPLKLGKSVYPPLPPLVVKNFVVPPAQPTAASKPATAQKPINPTAQTPKKPLSPNPLVAKSLNPQLPKSPTPLIAKSPNPLIPKSTTPTLSSPPPSSTVPPLSPTATATAQTPAQTANSSSPFQWVESGNVAGVAGERRGFSLISTPLPVDKGAP